MEQPSTYEPNGLVATAQRTLRVLEAVAELGDGTTAKAVVRRTGLSSSTAYQYLNTLVHEGYLVRLHDAGGYGLGWKSSALHLALPRTTNVAALYDLHRQAAAPFYIVRFRGARPEVTTVFDSPIYPRAREDVLSFCEALHASAFGRIYLSSLSPLARRSYFDSMGMKRLTRRTPTRPREVEEKIEEVYSTGISVEAGEFVPGLVCVAVPIRNASGALAGAVAASASRDGFLTRRREIEFGVRNAAARLSGWHPSDR